MFKNILNKIGWGAVALIAFVLVWSNDHRIKTIEQAITTWKFSCSNEQIIGTLKKSLLNVWFAGGSYPFPEMLLFINQEKLKEWTAAEDAREKGVTITKKEVAQKIRAHVTEEIMHDVRFTHIRTLEEGPHALSCELIWEDMDTSVLDNGVVLTSPRTGKPVTGRDYLRGATSGSIQSTKDVYSHIQYEVVLDDDGVGYGVRIVGKFGKFLDSLPPMPDEIRQEWFDGK